MSELPTKYELNYQAISNIEDLFCMDCKHFNTHIDDTINVCSLLKQHVNDYGICDKFEY